jgi:formylglycine-generating enzyme required for sulfatase activity
MLYLFLLGCPEPIDVNSVGPSDQRHMVKVIDKEHPQGVFWIDEFEFPNRPHQKARAYTSVKEAKESCNEVGKRLCTAAEWRRACLGPFNKRFSYGHKYEQKKCHTSASLPSGHSSMMRPEEMLIESGQKQHCQSEEGVFDMIGNLEEWVIDDWQGASASLEGGAWYTYSQYADCTGQYSRQPDYRTPLERKVYSAGFRCCWTHQEPDTTEFSRDAKKRLEMQQTSESYDSTNEVQLAKNTYIDRFEYPNRINIKPNTVVSWVEAKESCTSAGKRLCEAYEWEYACSGSQGWDYPYGNQYINSSCAIEQSENTKSGTYFGCISPSGAQDMVGSVWEWTSSPLDAAALKNNPDDIPYEIRGGSWFVDRKKGVCRPKDGYPLTASTNRYADLGFRCCRGDKLSLVSSQKSETQCPDDMTAVNNHCVDKFEYPNIPKGNALMDITLVDAQKACLELGKHLCTNLEWEQACSGTELRRWPYGNTYNSSACHDLGDRRQEGGGNTVPSGSFKQCVTPEGIFDMSGNLWEWAQDDEDPTKGSLRGGGWNLSAGLGQCRVQAPANSTYHAGEVGFRCCANPQESDTLRRRNKQ